LFSIYNGDSGLGLVIGNSESEEMIVGLSENRYIPAAKKTTEVRTTTAKDRAYNKTTIEFLLDLYHDKKIFVKIPMRPILNP
jgi:hypothetical protein